MTRTRHLLTALTAAGLLAAALSGCGGSNKASDKSSGTTLSGLLAITAGKCTGSTPTGSYFRMVTPTGHVGKGPYVTNADSNSVTAIRTATNTAGKPIKVGSY